MKPDYRERAEGLYPDSVRVACIDELNESIIGAIEAALIAADQAGVGRERERVIGLIIESKGDYWDEGSDDERESRCELLQSLCWRITHPEDIRVSITNEQHTDEKL